MKHPTIAVVLRLETEANHDSLQEDLSNEIAVDYSSFSEKSRLYRSQFRLWEGEISELRTQADFFGGTIGHVYNKMVEFKVVACSLQAEIAVFTYSDNQQVVIPQPLVKACVFAKADLVVYYFRCSDENGHEKKGQGGMSLS